jgi:hypothetical protein
MATYIRPDALDASVPALVSRASGLAGGENPPYTPEMFYAVYPQFAPYETEPGVYSRIVPEEIILMNIAVADSMAREKKWGAMWQMAMGLAVAHFTALWLQGSAPAGSPAEEAAAAAMTAGLESSKSVGPVSVSYDYSLISEQMKAWGTWNLTAYGAQYVTYARLAGKTGMYVW